MITANSTASNNILRHAILNKRTSLISRVRLSIFRFPKYLYSGKREVGKSVPYKILVYQVIR